MRLVSDIKPTILRIVQESPDLETMKIFHSLSYSLTLSYLRLLQTEGQLTDYSKLGLAESDLADDCVAGLFAKDESNSLTVIKSFYIRHFGDKLNDASNDELLAATRRLIFAEVSSNLYRIATESYPELRDILRKVKDTLRSKDASILSFSLRDYNNIDLSIQSEHQILANINGRIIIPKFFHPVLFNRWATILKELKELIDDPKTKERDLQNFLQRYPELLTIEGYRTAIPQASIFISSETRIWRADFVLVPLREIDSPKITELKKPNLTLLNKSKSGHLTFSSKIWAAISQLRDYAKAFEDPLVRKRFSMKYGIDVYYPKLHLIAGRIESGNISQDIRALIQQAPVQIDDWNSFWEGIANKL